MKKDGKRRDVGRRRFFTDRALILQVMPAQRSDRWVMVYTRGHGLMRCTAPAARRPKRHWGGVLVPLAQGDITLKISSQQPDWSYLIDFQLAWNPFRIRSATPEYLFFLAYCCEVALPFVREHEPDTELFDRLCILARQVEASVPLRAVAVAWTWTLLWRHGDLSLEGDCPACARSVRAYKEAALWDLGGHLWHTTCGRSRVPEGLRLHPDWARILAALQRDPGSVLTQHGRSLARQRSLLRYLQRRAEYLLGHPLKTLQTARAAAFTEISEDPREP